MHNIWSAIEVTPSDDSRCESCGLPGYALRTVPGWKNGDPTIRPAVGYKIPGVAGFCCSISCLECFVFGPGRCRSCGSKLGEEVKVYGKTEQEYRGGTRYCADCAGHPNASPLGDGERLKTYLRRNHPGLFKLEGPAIAGKRCALGKKCLRYKDRKPGAVTVSNLYCSNLCADTSRAVAQRAKSPIIASETRINTGDEGGSLS
jgi:hypothetical protein